LHWNLIAHRDDERLIKTKRSLEWIETNDLPCFKWITRKEWTVGIEKDDTTVRAKDGSESTVLEFLVWCNASEAGRKGMASRVSKVAEERGVSESVAKSIIGEERVSFILSRSYHSITLIDYRSLN
jgi:hypothetical protein